MLQTSEIILITYKTSTYFNFLTHMFVICASSGKQFYGQVCPTRQPRKKKIIAAWPDDRILIVEMFSRSWMNSQENMWFGEKFSPDIFNDKKENIKFKLSIWQLEMCNENHTHTGH